MAQGERELDQGLRRVANPSAWNPLALTMLGKKPDAQLAAELGLKRKTVAAKQRKLGILRVPQWTSAEEALVGTMPDAVLAQRLGETRSAVKQRRLLLKRPRVPE